MSLLNYYLPGNFKQVYDMSLLTGTIVSVNYNDNTAYVIVNDALYANVPVFYHCSGRSSIQRGAFAFRTGDQVRVINPSGVTPLMASNMKIIGFTDGTLHPCSIMFYVKVIKSDPIAGVVGDKEDDVISFSLVDSYYREMELTWSYQSDPTLDFYEYWVVEILDARAFDEENKFYMYLHYGYNQIITPFDLTNYVNFEFVILPSSPRMAVRYSGPLVAPGIDYWDFWAEMFGYLMHTFVFGDRTDAGFYMKRFDYSGEELNNTSLIVTIP